MTPTNFLNTQQAAELLSVSGSWLRQRKAKKIFKPGTHYVYSTGNIYGTLLWDVIALQEWQRDQTCQLEAKPEINASRIETYCSGKD